MASKEERVQEAMSILKDLDLPRAQRNERSALCLLAIVDLDFAKPWSAAAAPLMGITPIMDWVRSNYDKDWAPNTREIVRRQTMHQFVDAGIALYNPDEAGRAVNSPHAVYQIAPTCLAVLKSFETHEYELRLKGYLASRETLAQMYAKHRDMKMVPISLGEGQEISLSPVRTVNS